MNLLQKVKSYCSLKSEILQDFGVSYYYEQFEDHTDEWFQILDGRVWFNDSGEGPFEPEEGKYCESINRFGVKRASGLVFVPIDACTGDRAALIFAEKNEIKE